MKIKYFSAFSGIGGFELGMPKEWECVCEITEKERKKGIKIEKLTENK